MSDKPTPQTNIDIGMGVRASLEARVSTDIPSQSSGRLVDALTDLIRPFSERRGLRADQIRLQREDVLIEIAKKASHRLAIEDAPLHTLPNKFFVPFLEQASLEELDSPLVDRWADLLTSSVLNPQRAHPRFLSILSEITHEQVTFLQRLSRNGIDACRDPWTAFNDCHFDYEEDSLRSLFLTCEASANPEEIFDFFKKNMTTPGVGLIYVTVEGPTTDSSFGADNLWSSPASDDDVITDSDSFSIDVLASLDVLSKYSVTFTNPARLKIIVYYIVLTRLGVEFLLACDRELSQLLDTPVVDKET